MLVVDICPLKHYTVAGIVIESAINFDDAGYSISIKTKRKARQEARNVIVREAIQSRFPNAASSWKFQINTGFYFPSHRALAPPQRPLALLLSNMDLCEAWVFHCSLPGH